jgi:hypothetical protein
MTTENTKVVETVRAIARPRHGAASALPIRYGVYHPDTSKVDRTSLSGGRWPGDTVTL